MSASLMVHLHTPEWFWGRGPKTGGGALFRTCSGGAGGGPPGTREGERADGAALRGADEGRRHDSAGGYLFLPGQYWDVHKTVAITNVNLADKFGIHDPTMGTLLGAACLVVWLV